MAKFDDFDLDVTKTTATENGARTKNYKQISVYTGMCNRNSDDMCD